MTQTPPPKPIQVREPDTAGAVAVQEEPRWERTPTDLEAFAPPEHDSRSVVTQHAFRIAPPLLGLPLASPWRRLAAMSVDGLLVVMVSDAGGVMLAAVAAIFAYSWLRSRAKARDSKRSRLGRGFSASGYLLLAIMIFAIAVSLLEPLWQFVGKEWSSEDSAEESSSEGLQLDPAEAIAFGVAAARLQACDTAVCRSQATQVAAGSLADTKSPLQQRLAALDSLIDEATDDSDERQALREQARSKLAVPPTLEADAPPTTDSPQHKPEPKKREYSLLKQLLALLDDLGLSLGWAAAYFTLFTTLWAGQTPGKRLFGIRVVQLTGKPLSYWDSFERFGGYAAGFTTGLLGFVQVFWKPNRQAIQDQLTFTAVIRDVSRPVAPIDRA